MDAQAGMMVRINRGGPESLTGRILGLKSDFVVLKTTEGVVYVSNSHVKSVTELPGRSSGLSHANFVDADNFVGVLRALQRKFVQLNWGGPERIEGFVAGVGNNALLLVVGPELVQVPLYHIRTVKTAGIYSSGGSKGSQGSNGSNGSNGSSGGSGGSGGSKGSGGSGGSKGSGGSGGSRGSGGSGGSRGSGGSGGSKGSGGSGGNRSGRNNAKNKKASRKTGYYGGK